MELKQFKKFSNREKIDIIPYIKEYINGHKNVNIWIGTDSQNRKHNTIYALVICLRIEGKGAHLLYTKYEVPRIKENRDRLIKETFDTIEMAEYIKEQIGIKCEFLDLDLNPDKQFGSNIAFAACVGICSGYGYNFRHKGNSVMTSYAADVLVK